MTTGMRAALDSLRAHLAGRAGQAPARVLAAVAVKDRDAALPFYQRLFGRPADLLPMPVDAEWNAGATTLQVVQDPERAGASLVTLAVDDLRRTRPPSPTAASRSVTSRPPTRSRTPGSTTPRATASPSSNPGDALPRE